MTDQTNQAAAPAPASDAPANTGAAETQQGQSGGEQEGQQTQLLFEQQEDNTNAPAGDTPPANADDANADGNEAPAGENGEGEDQEIEYGEFTSPDDLPISPESRDEFVALLKETKVTKDQAQKLIDMHVKMRQREVERWNELKDNWRKEAEKDPEIGGDKLKTSVKLANDVVRKFAGSPEQLDELRNDLILLGLGNKPSFIRLMANIAKATSDDTQDGGGNIGEGKKSFGEVLFGGNMA